MTTRKTNQGTIDINALQQDAHNFNKGTDEGRRLMDKSFQELGAGRSILLDKDNNIIAGNKSQEAAIRAGIKRVRVIETDGSELVAVKRTDVAIDSERGRRLALADNATQQVNLSWDETELAAVADQIQGFDPPEWGVDMADIGPAADDGDMLVQGDGDAASTPCRYLCFDKIKIPLSDEDCARFTAICDAYIKEYGVYIGLGHQLIERYDTDSEG